MSFNKLSRKVALQIIDKFHTMTKGYKPDAVSEGLMVTSKKTLNKLKEASKLDYLFPAQCFAFGCVPIDLRIAVPYQACVWNKSLSPFSAISLTGGWKKNWQLPTWSRNSVNQYETKSTEPGLPKDSQGKPDPTANKEGLLQAIDQKKLEEIRERYKKEAAEAFGSSKLNMGLKKVSNKDKWITIEFPKSPNFEDCIEATAKASKTLVITAKNETGVPPKTEDGGTPGTEAKPPTKSV